MTLSVIGALFAVDGASYADTTSHAINDSIPAFQQSHYLAARSRSTSTTPSTVTFTSTTGALLLNVKAQNLQNNAQYTELKGIGPDSTDHNITNKTPAGQQSRLIITQYDYNAITVTAKGSYVIN